MSKNGELDIARELVPVSGSYLRPITARAFGVMAIACLKATGVSLDIVNGSGGYRDLTAQRILYRNPPAGITVAPPGTSTHGQGYALDLTTTCYTPAVAAWCRSHCQEYGFTVPPSNDPRHFMHNGITLGPAGEKGEAIDMATTKEVWETPLNYATGLADSAGVRIVDIQKAVDKLLAQSAPVTLTDAQLDVLADKIAARIHVPTKGTITLTQ